MQLRVPKSSGAVPKSSLTARIVGRVNGYRRTASALGAHLFQHALEEVERHRRLLARERHRLASLRKQQHKLLHQRHHLLDHCRRARHRRGTCCAAGGCRARGRHPVDARLKIRHVQGGSAEGLRGVPASGCGRGEGGGWLPGAGRRDVGVRLLNRGAARPARRSRWTCASKQPLERTAIKAKELAVRHSGHASCALSAPQQCEFAEARPTRVAAQIWLELTDARPQPRPMRAHKTSRPRDPAV